MTVDQVWSALLRRWPILLAGVLLTVALCVMVWRAPGVYWAMTKVYFLPPIAQQQPNQLAPDSSSPLAFAGVIQHEINEGRTDVKLTDPEVTLVDRGIDDGWSVRLPDYGGQWASDFRQAVLIVQASGPSEEVVRQRMDMLIGRIRDTAAQREDAAGVEASERFGFHVSPAATEIRYVAGHRTQAVVVVMGLGVALSAAGCVLVDRATGRGKGAGRP